MEVDTKVLDILFRKMSPSHVLQRIRRSGSVIDLEADKKLFQRFAVAGLEEFSLDEQELIFSRLQSEAAKLAARKKWGSHRFNDDENDSFGRNHMALSSLAFFSVLDIANRFITQMGQDPVCYIDRVLPWRETFLLLGQDLFVCAFLAQEDLRNRWERKDFTWPAVLRTDHVGLNHLLEKGLAENHQHLYGSSQTFALSWCNLMNYPKSHLEIGKEFDVFFQPFVSIGAEDRLFSTRDRVRYACLCRSHLFQWLKLKDGPCVNCCMAGNVSKNCAGRCWSVDIDGHCPHAQRNTQIGCSKKSLWSWLDEFHPELHMDNDLRQLRVLYGAKVPQKDGSFACLDYSLEEHIFRAVPNAAYRSLAGERHFLYSCFRAFLQGEMGERTKLLFYLYIILKAQFRSELIQVNKQIGFRNFSNYQDRKAMLCNKPFYWGELYRMALNAPLNEENVTSLETRIIPQKTVEGNMKRISEADKMHYFANIKYDQLVPYRKIKIPEFELNAPHFYVFHFAKCPDEDPKELATINLTYRHHRLRKHVRDQAVALAKALSNSSDMCQRTRGIDSASHEIGCPPEVFATAYRFLRGFRNSDYYKKVFFVNPPSHWLSATFHAGEDFLDIAGALRTIDEAITFLEFRRGDRIGHALGLGIDPKIHYALKGQRIFVRKQDRLDDLVWLLYRSRELGVHMDAHLYGILKKDAETLLLEIYGDAISASNWHITLTEYYCSMQLRADDPELYRTMEFVPPRLGLQYDEFKTSNHDTALENYRKSKELAGMYFYYHYGKREKIRGNAICEVEITPEYITLMRQTQEALQKTLAEKGIIIECNPSSNVLIGTFRTYNCHPIFRFNNMGIELDNDLYQSSTQLQVCINTDDLGVFDTSLEFEYALLYHTLKQMYNFDGSQRFNEGEILQYLENIRTMGQRAIFPKNKNIDSDQSFIRKSRSFYE